MNFTNTFRVKPHQKVNLSDFDPDETAGFEKEHALEQVEKNSSRLAELQHLLYADNHRALLIVLQAMDAGGKDGTVSHVMSGVNPQGCRVTSFKVPSVEEKAHDFLWRVHKAVPARGEIGIFNRSHYEDVLVARVHHLVRQSVWSERYWQINAFEEILVENQVTILKFFLHISKEEQKERLKDRLKEPDKYWKLSPSDFDERRYWDQYQKAYQDVLRRCSQKDAPWFIIPSNKKWFRNFAVSQILIEALEAMDMKFPPPSFDPSKIVVK